MKLFTTVALSCFIFAVYFCGVSNVPLSADAHVSGHLISSELPAAPAPSTSFDISRLHGHINRAILTAMLGPGSRLIDSMPATDANKRKAQVYVFAPIRVFGFESIAHALFYHDTLEKLTFYMPYHAHGNQLPEIPYEAGKFIYGTKTDYDSIVNRMSRQFGSESISAEAFIVFISDSTRPYIATNFAGHTIEMAVTPRDN